jgi:glycosyltransferase involved in cell wall biosynthesis
MQPLNKSIRTIVHVTFGLDVGGQEKLLVDFARIADRKHFELRFISLGSRGLLANDIESLGCPVITLDAPSGLRPSLVIKLARLFRRWRPEAVHTHDQRALFYAGPAAWMARVPMTVHTRHGRDAHASPRQTLMIRHLSKLVDRFVCVSQEVAELSREQGIGSSRLRTIKNGIDTNRFRLSGPCQAGPVVTVARLSPEKDVANLVRATAIASEQSPDLRVEIAGGGPCLEDLKQLAASLDVSDRITFLGEVRDIPALLSRARMFVLPSRSEGIPLTVLEAMACGLPIVATRVGGLPEVVDHGVTGLLVPSADPAALAQAIIGIWSGRVRGDRLGCAAHQRAGELFDVRRMVARYETLYSEGLGSNGRRGGGRNIATVNLRTPNSRP